MLQKVREYAAGPVVKILFIVLVASFALWGIGDYAFLRRGDDIAIRVGDVKITANQFANEYRREFERLRRAFGGQLEPETAKQFGLADQVVERVVDETAFELEANRLGIVISSQAVQGAILADPMFRGPGGAFDSGTFQRLLAQNGLTEAQYVSLMRKALARAAVADSISAGAWAPDVLVDRLYRHREERRQGEVVFVPNASIENVGEPDEAQIKSVYDDNIERFAEPERRALTVVRIGIDDLVKTIKPSEEQIREEYQSRVAELRVPERRDIDQVLFAGEEAARQAAAKLDSGTPFTEVAKELAGQAPEQTRLDGVEKRELVPVLADAVFAAPQGDVVGPIQSPLGWHLVRVAAVHPAAEPPLEQLRAQLSDDVARRLAANSAYNVAVTVEDAVAAGAKLAEAANKGGVEPVKVSAIDARGLDPKGEPEVVLMGAPEAVLAAFQTPQGQISQLVESRNGAFFLVQVDGITPTRNKSLEEVRAQAVELWQAEQRGELAKKRAESILERVAKGDSLEAAAAEFNLKPEITAAVRRDGSADQSRIAPEIASQLFALKTGEAAVVAGGDGHSVVRLTEIRAADPSADAEGLARLRTQVGQQIGNELIQQLATALRARFGVAVNRDIIDRVL